MPTQPVTTTDLRSAVKALLDAWDATAHAAPGVALDRLQACLPALRAALQAKPDHSGGWVSAFDRLPEPGQEVVYYFEITGATHGRFESGTCQADALFTSRRGFLTGDVTHWMPLPPPTGSVDPVGASSSPAGQQTGETK